MSGEDFEITASQVKGRFNPIRYGLYAILALTVIYVAVYQIQPLPTPWNDVYLNLAIAIPAAMAAFVATLTWRLFEPGDRPRPVWLYLSLGIWCWTVAEFVWLVIWLANGEVTGFSLVDIFWLLAYIPFALSFLLQYRLVVSPSRNQEIGWMAFALAAVLIGSLAGTSLLRSAFVGVEEPWGTTFLNMFYVAADAAIMLAAFVLARLFGRGLWGRAWLGLLALVVADALYVVVSIAGMYAQAAESGNLISLAVDTLYALAFMALALSCYSQYLLVRYGPTIQLPSKDKV